MRIIGEPTKIQNGDAVLVPAGARHNVINTGGEPLRLYILYAPLNTATEPCTRQRRRPSERKSISTERRPNLDDTIKSLVVVPMELRRVPNEVDPNLARRPERHW